MSASDKLVLVDGTAMAYRAFYKLPGNLQTSEGIPTNASFGFATMFRKLFAGRKPTFGAVIFDPSGPTFRDLRYSGYKADRAPMPEPLRIQLPWIRKVVEAFNFPQHTVDGFEADDVIGTLTANARARGIEVLIVSGDKDFAQLIASDVKMLDAMREVTYDPELVRKKWGVPPGQFVDLLALLGDKIDNIPGVPGIGQKSATTLLETYGSLESILDHLEDLKPRQRGALSEHQENARLSKELATIKCDVPLPFDLEDLRLSEPEPAKLNGLFRMLEFFSLLDDADRQAVEVDDREASYRLVGAEEAAEELESQQGLVAVEPLRGPEHPAHADLVGMAFSAQPGSAFYVSIQPGEIPTPLIAYLEDEARPKVVHNAKHLLLLGLARGVEIKGLVGDTMLGSFLVDPNKIIPHRLDQISKEFLQRTLRPLKRLVGSGQSQVHPRAVVADEARDFACHRADAIGSAWSEIEPRLEALNQIEHLRERDLPLSRVLARMELHGILVDREDIEMMGNEFRNQLVDLEKQAHDLAGQPFNLASTKQLSQVLFEDLKLPIVKRTKTGYSTNSEVLERLRPKHEIADVILEWRKISKLITTYTNVLHDAVHPETKRIHADFQQTASQTGRLISTDPDLQRTPIRTPEGKRIRRAFIAPPGHQILSADWSQIELRILAHVSGDPRLKESFQAREDVHRRTASELFSVPPEAITPAQRNVGKTVNFATIYGQGATALGQILGVPRKEAEAYIQRYFETYAGVRAWLDDTIRRAMETGYVETMFGRRRIIPELSSHAFMEQQAGQRIAANTPIQGSAADLCKLAMQRIDASLESSGSSARMIMQIHDELVFEVPNPEVAAVTDLVVDHMENVVKLDVPLVAEVGSGASWAEAH
ncbi:MAG: DNA polymerase I [Myxococcota bacterium]